MKKLITLLLLTPLFAFALNGLEVGEKSPIKSLVSVEGKTFDLTKTKKTVLIFYRGSWCPYCVKQLKSVESEVFKKYGEQANIIGLSVDKKSVVKKMKKKFDFGFDFVSDTKAKLLLSFKIANNLEDSLVKKYKTSYKIDVEKDSGETHHIVAHPAVFIIEAGKIIYADIHTSYKERTKNSEIISILKQ